MNQNSLIRKFSRVVILTTAFLVFWIYLGSLINFHQHHIFGRSLMPQGILSKRDESLQAAANYQAFPVLVLMDLVPGDDLLQEPVELTLFSEPGTNNELTLKSGLPLCLPLRGPPTV